MVLAMTFGFLISTYSDAVNFGAGYYVGCIIGGALFALIAAIWWNRS